MVTACFIQNDDLYFSVYHRYESIQKSFIYSWKEDKIISEIGEMKLDGATKTNFPIKSFYNCLDNEIYTFYRQGHAVERSSILENTNLHQEKISNADLGQMFIVFDKALIVRSSNSMLFFKKDEEEGKWKQYHKIDNTRGNIFFIRGNIRIQITTETKIYFYLIDKETFEPELENVMYNFINCSSLMFGSRVRYGIAFKAG